MLVTWHHHGIVSTLSQPAATSPQWLVPSSSFLLSLTLNLLLTFVLTVHIVLDLVADIATTCETWYTQKRDGREHLVTQTVSYLLIHAIDHGKQTGVISLLLSLPTFSLSFSYWYSIDVKRVCALREALMLIDFQDERYSPSFPLSSIVYLHLL